MCQLLGQSMDIGQSLNNWKTVLTSNGDTSGKSPYNVKYSKGTGCLHYYSSLFS